MCKGNTSTTGERDRVSTVNVFEIQISKQSREQTSASFVLALLGKGSGLSAPALVQESVLSPGKRDVNTWNTLK
jgi:hypothetical protein